MTDKDTAEGLLREALVILQREFDHDLIETNPDCEGCKLVARIESYLATVAPTDTNEERKE
jgi:hypothetical protein